jgi:DMSO/TMAO reductase YedYZ molybdopterin-dependent catalytic subunit
MPPPRLRSDAFSDLRLPIEGRVARPGAYSLADLKRFPSRTQITKHTCEEGWSAIAEWTGAPVRLRVETQLGYKSVKYLQRIVVTNEFDDLGKIGPLQNGWAWYAGI